MENFQEATKDEKNINLNKTIQDTNFNIKQNKKENILKKNEKKY